MQEKQIGIIAWIAFGLLAGLIAQYVMPGKPGGNLVLTLIIGIAGAAVGGFIGTAVGFGDVKSFDVRSLLLAVGGGVLLLFLYRKFG